MKMNRRRVWTKFIFVLAIVSILLVDIIIAIPGAIGDGGIVDSSSAESIITSSEENQSITILNPQSYPYVGDNWTIYFNTTGSGVLEIHDHSFPEEVGFVGIYQKDGDVWNWVPANITGDLISADWNYTEGRAIFKVLTPGEHILEFRFGNVAYARNQAGYTFPANRVFDAPNGTTGWDWTSNDGDISGANYSTGGNPGGNITAETTSAANVVGYINWTTNFTYNANGSVTIANLSIDRLYSIEAPADNDADAEYSIRIQKPVSKTWITLYTEIVSNATYTVTLDTWEEPITNYSISSPETIFDEAGMYNLSIDTSFDTTLSDDWTIVGYDNIELYIEEVFVTLTLGNITNLTQDWGRDFNLNHSVTATNGDAENVNVTYNLSWITNNNTMGALTTDATKWHNQTLSNYTVQNVTVEVNATTTNASAINDSETFWINITKRTASSTMDSPSTQIVKTSETFYINATVIDEYNDNYIGNADLLNDSGVVSTSSVTNNAVNFSRTETADGVHNLSVRFYNKTHYFNTTTPTNSTVTVDGTSPAITIDMPTTASPVYRIGGELFYVNFTYTEVYPANYTVEIYNSTAVINTTTVNYPVGGTDQVANESFYLNISAADGFYNVSVETYDNASNYVISYQNNSVVKDSTNITITIDEPTTSSPVYRKSGELFYVNFTYTEGYPANYTVEIYNSTAVINTTTVNYPVGGTDQVANESFYLNLTAADGWYNVSARIYDNSSNYVISYQNNSVVKDATSPTVTIDEPTTSSMIYRTGGELFWVNFTYTEGYPANYTVSVFNSTAVINTTTVNYPAGGTDKVANESFYLNLTAADGWYNVSVNMYDNSSNYVISYQNNSVVKDSTNITITIDEPTTSSPVYRIGGELFWVNFTYTEENPANYTVNIFNSSAVINTTTVNYPVDGTDQVANVSFNINTSAAAGWYNVSVEMYDNCSNYVIYYQNNSVVKDETSPTITINEPTTASPVYKNGGELFWVNFTYSEVNPANYTVNIFNITAVINTTTVNYPVDGTDQVANVSFNINTSAADGWYNVSVGIYDNASNYVISYQNKSVAKGDIPPTITTPPDQTVEVDRTNYITWNVTDNDPKNYWVLRNGVEVVAPTAYTSGVEVNVEIDTSTLGIWNYTIFANDTTGNVATDEVIITVSIRSLALPEFNIIGLIALICTLSIVLSLSTFRRKD
ncbi:hypothetical protein ACFLY8_02855 [Halobacteriota archaeon]